MDTLGKYLTMPDSELEEIIIKERRPYSRRRLPIAAGALALGAAALVSGNASAAPQKATHFIQPATISIYCAGNEYARHEGLMANAMIEVPYGCEISLENPTVAKDRKGENPIDLDFMIKNEKTGKYMVNEVTSHPQKSEFSFPPIVDTKEYMIGQGRKIFYITAETGPNKEDQKASLPIIVDIVKPLTAEKTGEGNADNEETSLIRKAIEKERSKFIDADELEENRRKKQSTPGKKPRFSAAAGINSSTWSLNADSESLEGFGGELSLEYEGDNAFVWAQAGVTSFDENRDWSRLKLSEYSAGVHLRKGPLMIGAEALGSSLGYDNRYGYNSYGMPRFATFGYNARAGIFLGKGFNDSKFALHAFVLYGKLIQEERIDDRWDDWVIDSRDFTEKGFGAIARINEGLRVSFYKTEAKNPSNTVTLKNQSLAAELSFGIGKEKKIRPYVSASFNESTESCGCNREYKSDFTRVGAGVRFTIGRR